MSVVFVFQLCRAHLLKTPVPSCHFRPCFEQNWWNMPFSFSLKKSFSFSQACSYFGVLNMGVKCISSFFLMFSVSSNVYSLMNAIIGAIGLIPLFYIQGSFGMLRPENLHSNLNFEPDFPFSSTSFPGPCPYLECGAGKGPGIGWSRAYLNIHKNTNV